MWMVAGNAAAAAELVGLSDEQRAGGVADLEAVARWLDDGSPPMGRRAGGSPSGTTTVSI